MTGRTLAVGVIAWLLICAAWICAAYLLITKEESA